MVSNLLVIPKSAFLIIILVFLAVAAGHSQSLPIVNGRASSLAKPEYPKEAEEFCSDGEVRVEVAVENGRVRSAEAVSGDELLQPAAVAAARQALFAPYPIPFFGPGIIVYNFKSTTGCIKAGVVNNKARVLPKPRVGGIVHPRHVKLKKTEVVEVQIIISLDGAVIRARAISGHQMLRPACVVAARNARFAPTLINTSKPIRVRATLIYKIKPDGTVEL